MPKRKNCASQFARKPSKVTNISFYLKLNTIFRQTNHRGYISTELYRKSDTTVKWNIVFQIFIKYQYILWWILFLLFLFFCVSKRIIHFTVIKCLLSRGNTRVFFASYPCFCTNEYAIRIYNLNSKFNFVHRTSVYKKKVLCNKFN